VTRRILLLFVNLIVLTAAAQQPPLTRPQPASTAVELEPLVVDDSKHSGDVVLTVNLDATGTVTDVTHTTGDADLVPYATKFAKLFRNSQFANTNNLTQHVVFLHGSSAIKKVAPVYPPIARAAHVSGVVLVGVAVGADGHVMDAKALAGPPMLQGSAVECVRQWVFPPEESNGSLTNFRAVILITYALQGL
jgi:TonB family protein